VEAGRPFNRISPLQSAGFNPAKQGQLSLSMTMHADPVGKAGQWAKIGFDGLPFTAEH
jgi:hypothetical protein